MSQRVQYQDLETEAAKWNSAIIHFIIYTFAFPTMTCQMSSCADVCIMSEDLLFKSQMSKQGLSDITCVSYTDKLLPFQTCTSSCKDLCFSHVWLIPWVTIKVIAQVRIEPCQINGKATAAQCYRHRDVIHWCFFQLFKSTVLDYTFNYHLLCIKKIKSVW